jgi:predicted double-glycine peptidase
LSNIDSIENRIRQIEQKIDRGPSIDSAVFHQMMASETKSPAPAKFGSAQPNVAMNKLNYMSMNGVHFNPNIRPSNAREVQPLAQSNGVSCGQTSVAMCINSLTGQSLTDMDIDQKYGFGLLNALKSESASSGYDWRDNGNLSADSWATIDQKVNQEKLPVVVALNGPEFSPSGRGHIVTILKTEGDTVTYADPADGTVKTTSKINMQTAPSHPDGNFVFVADRLNATPPAAIPQMPMASTETDGDGFMSF